MDSKGKNGDRPQDSDEGVSEGPEGVAGVDEEMVEEDLVDTCAEETAAPDTGQGQLITRQGRHGVYYFKMGNPLVSREPFVKREDSRGANESVDENTGEPEASKGNGNEGVLAEAGNVEEGLVASHSHNNEAQNTAHTNVFSSSDDEPPDSKRSRSLEDSDSAQRLFEQKLTALATSGNVGVPMPSNDSGSLVIWNPNASEVHLGSFGANSTANISNSGLNIGDQIRQAMNLFPPEPANDGFRDISDLSSVSSFSGFSIPAEEIRPFDPQLVAEPNAGGDWHSPNFSPSDDDWGSPPPFDVEFEVASVSIDDSNPIEDADSSSGLEDEGVENDHMRNADAAAAEHWDTITDETDNDADEELELEKSDDEASTKGGAEVGGVSDSELSDKDFWHCTQCNAKTNSPYLRYCLRCFRIRRNWLPKRPQPKNPGKKATRQRRNRSRNRRHTSSDEETSPVRRGPGLTNVAANSTTATTTSIFNQILSAHPVTFTTSTPSLYRTPDARDLDVVDSGPPKSSSSGPSSGSSSARPASTSTWPYTSNTSSENPLDFWDVRDFGPHPPSATIPLPIPRVPPRATAQTTETVSAQLLKEVLTRKPIKIKAMRQPPQSEEKETPLCSVCMVRDKDAAFVHGKTAHVYSCYSCADKILKKNGKCPICRKRILRVVKVINS